MKIIFIFASIIVGTLGFAIPSHNVSESGRISGGRPVGTPTTYPFNTPVYHAQVGFLCGGALIAENWAITTAQCVYAYAFEQPIRVYIEVGAMDINAGPQPGKVQDYIVKIELHPDFHQYENREDIYYNNLALLKMTTSFPPSAQINPIALPLITHIVGAGTIGILTGWGGRTDAFPVTRLEVAQSVQVMDIKKCIATSGMVIEDTEFCTEPNADTTACHYDHGSPLFEFDAVKGSILLGIVNYAPCAATFYPTVYANIPQNVFWINNVMAAYSRDIISELN